MFLRLIPVLALLLPAFACDVSTETSDLGRDGDAPAEGKADAIDDGAGAAACPADVYVTHAANDVNNHVFSNCHNAANGKFVNKSCCAEEMDLIQDISGCPSQVRFNSASGGEKRCVNDVAGDSGKGQFVPTACCAPLCDSTAQFDDYGYCRSGNGLFEEEICCHRSFKLSEANCGGAQWEAIEGGTRDFACRAGNGQFTFDACCVDACAEEISRTATIPEACNLDWLSSDDCPAGSTPNSGGICHNPENGQFVKAICCELSGNDEDLDIQASDDCYAGIAADGVCIAK